MSLIADGLMIVAGLVAGLYCLVLSRRLRQLTDSGQGIGAQIKGLSDAIAETRAAVAEARKGAEDSGARLGREVRRAEGLVAELRAAAKVAETAAQRPVAPDFLAAPSVPTKQDGIRSEAPQRRNADFETVFDDLGDFGGEVAATEESPDELATHASEISSVVDALSGPEARAGRGEGVLMPPGAMNAAASRPGVLHVERVVL